MVSILVRSEKDKTTTLILEDYVRILSLSIYQENDNWVYEKLRRSDLERYRYIPVGELPDWEAVKLDLMMVSLRQPRIIIINDFFLIADNHLCEIQSILKEYVQQQNIVILITDNETVLNEICSKRYILDKV